MRWSVKVFNFSLAPSDCFSLTVPIAKGKDWEKAPRLPSMSEWFCEESFAEVGVAWHPEGISVGAIIDHPLEDPEKDFLELFFDTRDLKTAGLNTRFCHHFLIIPQAGASREVTRFRTEDTHPLCDPNELEVTLEASRGCYSLAAWIPASCLHGYDPQTFARSGFTYQVNRHKGPPQHLAVSSRDYAIDQHPSLWATLTFT